MVCGYVRRMAGAVLLALFCCSQASAIPLADRVVVNKSQKKLMLLKDGIKFREYAIALGPRPRGHKLQEGDERTPEGSYILDFKNPNSDFHKSIRISYPNLQDRQRAQAAGVNPGGMIMIHGTPNDAELPPSLIQFFNWTDGCIAVSNEDMDEIWLAVRTGTPIDIYP